VYRKTTLSVLALMGILAVSGHASGQEGRIWTSVPASPDAGSRYLIYLHGQIIETGGRRPTSPQFGVYEYDAILREFAQRGFQVISEARPAGTQVAAYAGHVADQVHQLLAGGVPPEHIAVVGFSKGGMIAATTSSLLRTPEVRYVIMAGCTRGLLREDSLALTGAVLSIHEASDNIGLSCKPLFEHSADADVKVEKLIDTGARHGAFYRPRPEWLDPLFAWLGAGASVEGRPPVGLVLQPYTARTGPDEISIAPDLLEPKVRTLLAEAGLEEAGVARVQLTSEEAAHYGVWQHVAQADAHLGRAVAEEARGGAFVLGLLGNCNSSWGMLAGLQRTASPDRKRRVGLIWIDAHADFNTPETSLSGWLGGMPVSVASGQSLERLRLTAGLDPAIATGDIVMMGLRDVDPLEQGLLDRSGVTVVSAADMVAHSQNMLDAVNRLARRVDVIYLHVDVDILDATEIPGSFYETPGGPTAEQVARVLKVLMTNPKVAALGISSFPTAERGRQVSLASVETLVREALAGLKVR
jgi:arginase family enzyme